MGSIDTRVTRLETHFEYIRGNLGDIKDVLKSMDARMEQMDGRINHLPTKRDLTDNLLVCAAIGVAIIGLVIGGLGWLETRATRVQAAPTPIVIQVPQASQAAHAHP
jgi:hypothetical protein